MSYIQKIQGDYNNKLISLAELTTQRTNYGNASKEEKEAMDSEAAGHVSEAVSNSNSSLSVEGDIHSQLKRIQSTVDSNNRILNGFLILSVISVVCTFGYMLSLS